MIIQLTSVEKQGVVTTWEIARQNLTATGIQFFTAYFAKHSKKQMLFKRFANVSIDDLQCNRAFIAQATLVMATLDDIVSAVGSPTTMRDKMIQLGRYHKMVKLRAKMQDFQDFNDVLLDTFRTLMWKVWDEDAEQGWIKIFAMMQINMAVGLDV